MRWADERYVRLYTRDTVDWKLLPWQSKALWPLLMRKLDRAGYLELGKHSVAGLAAIVELPIDVVGPGLDGLVADGCLKLEGNTLHAPNFKTAQETRSSDRVRKAEQREREADEVTEVTSRHQPSPAVTDGHSSLAVLSSAVLRKKESTSAQSAEKPPTAPTSAATPFANYLRETWAEADDVPKQSTERLAELEAGWRAAYPAVDLLAEAKKARAWQLGDPGRRRKPRVLRFLAGWYGRSQQDASRNGNGTAAPVKRKPQYPTYRDEDGPRRRDVGSGPATMAAVFAKLEGVVK